MDLNQLSLSAIRNRLVDEARVLGLSVEDHAAAELHALEAKYGKVMVVAVAVAWLFGFVLGKVL
jgi:hypothetical protein